MNINPLVIKWARFHRANPHVYEHFKKFCFQAIKAGKRILSASLINERVRWECWFETNSEDPYKVCNTHRTYYARLFMEEHPEHAGCFIIRRLNGEAFAGELKVLDVLALPELPTERTVESDDDYNPEADRQV